MTTGKFSHRFTFSQDMIMDPSSSQKNNDFIDLMDPQEALIGSGKKEDSVPSFDFQPIRPIGGSEHSNIDSASVGGTRVWNSLDSKTHSPHVGIRTYNSLDYMEPAKGTLEKDHNAKTAALLSEIDQTMRKHADNLLHALEGVSARVSQLESRTHYLEDSMDDLKVSMGNNHGITDGKLRQLENILREVQSGVQVIRDKQDIMEGQLQLAKLQVSKVESASQSTPQSESQAASTPQQPHYYHQSSAIVQSPPALPPISAPTQASQQNVPALQAVNQLPPNQIHSVQQRDAYFPPPSQTQESPSQHYHLTPPQQLQPRVPAPPPQQLQPHVPAPPTQQQYQPPHPVQYSQPPLQPQQRPSLPTINSQPQNQPSMGHHPHEPLYPPPRNHPPNLSQPSPPPSHQFYGPPSLVYEQPSGRPNSGYPTAHGPSSGPNEPFPYSGSPSQYGQPLPSSGSGPKLPTAHALPQALPTATAVSGSAPTGSGNRVPIDDVVDRVTGMGFPRDQVRATVRKLTETGQSVDLNVVLDKLMNDEGQPQRGWYGR
ncbi:Non-specific serine/threonine protein kinase [Bertholletia excelsa]